MKQLLKLSAFLFLGWCFVSISCKKEVSCEGCVGNNKPPVANAGADQKTILPKDSVMLDGSASADQDGTITSYKWAKIAGPVSSNVNKPDSSKTMAKALVAGVYKFELTVTDNGGLSAKDTVKVIVDAPGNQPPVACAGAHQTITLPANSATLEGSCSADHDNNITAYAWIKISGPSSFNIVNANAIQTQVTSLELGIYQFELKVTDAGGLFSKDTVAITVNAGGVATACGENRPVVNARLIPIGKLSQSRGFPSVVSTGNKIFFAGGALGVRQQPFSSSRVDIYDIATGSWSTAELSVPRWQIATIAAGNKVFFAGGGYYDDSDNGSSYNTVDIFDITTNQWSTGSLTGRRHNVAAATVGNKVFFAGGRTDDYLDSVSNKVDIYDLATNAWST
jgi:hypothetical protein